ncbi:MAG: hypothetical protein PHS80_07545 [Methanothrix sp.]|nr:hypothetical protein [Methanothrix sp.]MDD4448963.1 hypothetical protein [Methanothrix sp.]
MKGFVLLWTFLARHLAFSGQSNRAGRGQEQVEDDAAQQIELPPELFKDLSIPIN